MKRIIISGYYGFGNTGDEAVLCAIVNQLRIHVPDCQITVLSNTPGDTSNLYNVDSISRNSISAVNKAIKDCDLLLSGGGSLIQDVTSFRSLAYYLGIISMAGRSRKKVMVIGQGIGPLSKGISRTLAARVLKRVNLFALRDAESADLLRKLGINRDKIHVTADPSLVLSPCSQDDVKRLLLQAGIGSDEDIVAVSLREWPKEKAIEGSITETIKLLSERIPARILLLSMQNPDDMRQAERLRENIGGSAVIQPKIWSPQQMLGVLSRSQMVVAMRLHALIFAASVGVPMVGISYDPKVESFLQALGQECISVKSISSERLARSVIDVWNRRKSLAGSIRQRTGTMREGAEENFHLVAKLISSR